MSSAALGIDIGGTNTAFGLVSENGKILLRGNVSTTTFPQPKELVKALKQEVDKVLCDNSLNISISGIGVGAPNGNFYKGTVEFAPNMQWFGVVPLCELLTEEFGVSATLTNDANAAALGEMQFGAAKGMRDFIFVTLGTGLGSGFVANGQMIYGHDSFAGELGHVIVEKDGRACGCGRKGCLETYASATGIKRTYSDLLMSKHKLSNPENKVADAQYIFEKATEGEDEAMRAFQQTGEWLGLALANAVAITSPEAIFLFGGLAQAGRYIFEPTIDYFEKNLLNIYKGKIKILSSGLPANDAAILGAASLVWAK